MSVCLSVYTPSQVIIKTLQLLLTLMNQESENRDSFLCKVKMECSLGLVRFYAPTFPPHPVSERTSERAGVALALRSIRTRTCVFVDADATSAFDVMPSCARTNDHVIASSSQERASDYSYVDPEHGDKPAAMVKKLSTRVSAMLLGV